MFCTNCGKDCGEFKFCPHCGTKLQAPDEKPAWSVGKPCPQCGGTEIKDGHCAFCGVRLVDVAQENDNQDTTLTEIPYGIYDGVSSSLTLYETECVVSNKVSMFKTCKTTIPYDKITAVVYVRKESTISNLLFRWEGDNGKPIPSFDSFGKDATSVAGSQRARRLFISSDEAMEVTGICEDLLLYHIFHALKNIAPKSAVFRMEVIPRNVEEVKELRSKTDVSTYYAKYAPFRDQAVKALCERTGAKKDVATDLINQLFDSYQEEAYTKDPAAALRDLNLIVAEKKQREALAKERLAEEHERVYLYSLLDDADEHD